MQPQQPPTPPLPQEPDTVAPAANYQDSTVANPLPAQVSGLPNLQMPDPAMAAELNLTQDEGLYCQITRHPIGLVQFYVSTAIGILLLLAMLYFFITHHESSGLSTIPTSVGVGVVMALAILLGIINSVAVKLYKMNHMFLTNESLIIETQNGLFNKRRKTLNLESIEDISYDQKGPMQEMLNYGTIHVATVGKDGVNFALAQNPKQYADYITNAREQFMRNHMQTR